MGNLLFIPLCPLTLRGLIVSQDSLISLASEQFLALVLLLLLFFFLHELAHVYVAYTAKFSLKSGTCQPVYSRVPSASTPEGYWLACPS